MNHQTKIQKKPAVHLAKQGLKSGKTSVKRLSRTFGAVHTRTIEAVCPMAL